MKLNNLQMAGLSSDVSLNQHPTITTVATSSSDELDTSTVGACSNGHLGWKNSKYVSMQLVTHSSNLGEAAMFSPRRELQLEETMISRMASTRLPDWLYPWPAAWINRVAGSMGLLASCSWAVCVLVDCTEHALKKFTTSGARVLSPCAAEPGVSVVGGASELGASPRLWELPAGLALPREFSSS